VDRETWGNPDRRRDVVRHPGAVAILPILPDGRVVLVRQYREAIRDDLLEVPAGVLDVPGESAENAARRELAEETGLRVRSIEPLHRIHTSPGFVDEAIHLFVADVEGEPVGQAEEGITEVVQVPMEDAVGMVHRGEIPDAKTALCILLANERLSAGR
jgi:ADP-ribose pyrophosphatase